MKLSVAEIINETSKLETDEEQIDWLKKHDNPVVRIVLKFWYDSRIEFLIPDTTPPYKPLARNNHGILYGKAKKFLPLFVKGGTGDNLTSIKREMKFIELLQIVHEEDAKILCKMISKKPLPFLSKGTISKAYPEIFE